MVDPHTTLNGIQKIRKKEKNQLIEDDIKFMI